MSEDGICLPHGYTASIAMSPSNMLHHGRPFLLLDVMHRDGLSNELCIIITGHIMVTHYEHGAVISTFLCRPAVHHPYPAIFRFFGLASQSQERWNGLAMSIVASSTTMRSINHLKALLRYIQWSYLMSLDMVIYRGPPVLRNKKTQKIPTKNGALERGGSAAPGLAGSGNNDSTTSTCLSKLVCTPVRSPIPMSSRNQHSNVKDEQAEVLSMKLKSSKILSATECSVGSPQGQVLATMHARNLPTAFRTLLPALRTPMTAVCTSNKKSTSAPRTYAPKVATYLSSVLKRTPQAVLR